MDFAQGNTNQIAIVTDSTADIPADLVRKHRIHVVPNIIIWGDRNLEDGKEITRQEFYEQLPSMKPLPTTATAAAGVYEELYAELFACGAQQVISAHASSKLSGIYNAASLAANEFDGRVKVIDSEQITLGLGFQVLAAAEAIDQGANLDHVEDIITNIRKRIRVVAMLDTLEYVRRSGRVSWAQAKIGALLRIKPFLEVSNGEVLSLGETRTFKKGVIRLADMLARLGPLEKLAVLHTNAEGEARSFAERYAPKNIPAPSIVNVTTVIGTHVGPHGLGFTAVIQ
jgi:DegV family protein with EDD domain